MNDSFQIECGLRQTFPRYAPAKRAFGGLGGDRVEEPAGDGWVRVASWLDVPDREPVNAFIGDDEVLVYRLGDDVEIRRLEPAQDPTRSTAT
jgi:hypothetical protein